MPSAIGDDLANHPLGRCLIVIPDTYPLFAEQSTKYNKLPSDATYRHYIYIDHYLREFKQSRMQYHVNKEQRNIPGTEFLTFILPSSSAKHQIQSRNQQHHPINGQSHTTTNKLSSPTDCMPHHSDKTIQNQTNQITISTQQNQHNYEEP